MKTLTARIDDWLYAEIRQFWEERGIGPSSGFRSIVEEWWTLQRFPHLEFRDGVTARRAGIRGGPDVWEVALVARDVGRDAAALCDHFGEAVSIEAVGEALSYADRFSETIEEMLAENERIERLLSQNHAG